MQGMKLLPTGRKNAFYLTLYGSMLGAGSFLMPQFSMMVNALLVNFGLSEEMHNLVSLFLLVGIIIAGAALGYWIVRKCVLSEDGSVDVGGIVEFVEWAICILAAILILQVFVSSSVGARRNCPDCCLILSKILDRRKFSEQEWEDSKAHWTRQAVSDLVSSPEFTDWAIGSDSGSTDEVTTKSSNRVSPFGFCSNLLLLTKDSDMRWTTGEQPVLQD